MGFNHVISSTIEIGSINLYRYRASLKEQKKEEDIASLHVCQIVLHERDNSFCS